MLGGKTEMICSCSYRKARWGVVFAGLAALLMVGPRPAWGQWNGTNPVWTNSNVGTATA